MLRLRVTSRSNGGRNLTGWHTDRIINGEEKFNEPDVDIQGSQRMFIPRHVDLHWELLKWAAILSLAVATAMAFARHVGGTLGW